MNNKKLLFIPSILIAVVCWATAAAAQTIVYDNTACDAFFDGALISQQLFEFGDQITLAGSERSVTAFSVGMAMIDDGNLSDDTARIRFYVNDGPVIDSQQSPGTILYDSGPIDISAQVGGPPFDLEVFPNVVVPANTFTWTVEFGGITPVPPPNPQQGFLVICQFPTVGSSGDFHWTHAAPPIWTTQDAPSFINNLKARVTAEFADIDGDLIPDAVDNWPTVPNNDQLDTNVDGFGDACVSTSATIDPSVTLGANPVIGDGTVINKDVTIGDNAQIGVNVTVNKDVTAGNNLTVGDGTVINKNVVIGDNAQIGSDVTLNKDIIVGDNFVVGDGTVISKEVIILDDVQIGAEVSIAKNVMIGNGVKIGLTCPPPDPDPTTFCTSIGQNTTIADGVTIGMGVNIGQGSTINGDVPNSTTLPNGPVFP